MRLRDRILHYAECVAFGVMWFYLLPVAFIGWWLFGDDGTEVADDLHGI